MRRLEEIKWDPNITEKDDVYNKTEEAVTWYLHFLQLEPYMASRQGPPLWTW